MPDFGAAARNVNPDYTGAFEAQFNRRSCDVCGDPILAGDWIVKHIQSGDYMHEECKEP